MNIILIGFMGTGKSRTGKLLAADKRLKFIDLDEFIEEQTSMSISQIFDQFGEKHFRDLETEQLKKVLNVETGYVLATGGGVVLREENMAMLKENGKVVLLSADPETIYNRVKNESYRPLLLVDNPLEKIKELLLNRRELYDKAKDIEIDTSGLSPDEVCLAVNNKLLEVE